MKYIRTKDGIIDFNKYELDYEHYDFYILKSKKHRKNGQDYTKLNKKCILKQADTIEELCDGFIFKDTNVNKLHFLNKNDGISLLGASLFEETVRGFIETDKGLIYVAKMNDKGELELL